jgi:hypothetical protein
MPRHQYDAVLILLSKNNNPYENRICEKRLRCALSGINIAMHKIAWGLEL